MWRLDFYADWQSGFLWAGDDATLARFGIPMYAEDLPLTAATRAELIRLNDWHDTVLNWASPADPGPLREDECARLNAAVHALAATLREELGSEWEVVDNYQDVHEDPDLDQYLQDPKAFRRKAR